MDVSRRGLILGIGGVVLAGPAIIKASSLMKIKPMSFDAIPPMRAYYYIWKPDENGYYNGSLHFGTKEEFIAAKLEWPDPPHLAYTRLTPDQIRAIDGVIPYYVRTNS